MKFLARYKMPGVAILLAAVAIFAISCKDDSSDTKTPVNPNYQFKISGKVIDEENFPVPYAVVVIKKNDTLTTATFTTDTSGRYSGVISDSVQAYALVLHPDFDTSKIAFSEFKTKSVTNPVILKHKGICTGRISVTVKSSSGGELISDANVILKSEGKIVKIIKTGTTGQAVFDFVCGGPYWLRVEKSGFSTDESYLFSAGDTLSTVVSIAAGTDPSGNCTSTLYGTFKDYFTAAPVTGVTVKLRKSALDYLSAVETGGDISLKDLCPGEYSVSLEKDHYKTYNTSLTIAGGFNTIGDIQMIPDSCCNNKIKVIATDWSTGKPMDSSKIQITYPDNKSKMFFAGEDGTAEIDNLCAGLYKVVTLRYGHVREASSFNLYCCDIDTVKAVMHTEPCCNLKLTIHVIDADKNPVAGASVTLATEEITFDPLLTDATGTVIFNDLCKYEFFLNVSKPGFTSYGEDFTMNCNDTIVKEVTLNTGASKKASVKTYRQSSGKLNAISGKKPEAVIRKRK